MTKIKPRPALRAMLAAAILLALTVALAVCMPGNAKAAPTDIDYAKSGDLCYLLYDDGTAAVSQDVEYNYYELTTVVIPSTITITRADFYNDPGTDDYDGIYKVTTIGDSAFDSNSDIVNLDLSGADNLREIRDGAFSNSTVANVNFSSAVNLEILGYYAFGGCSELKTVDFSGHTALVRLEDSAFSWSGVVTADFSGCTGLVSVEYNAFNSSALETIS
ncbi:MAG: leucine-rich repeat domain-containing protein, partial [Oscillospiraceae bacterium]|nr:leucine-rich repeat domain-containing protein [Oscillospiraceae bacterium]